jgi:hypothetical protein
MRYAASEAQADEQAAKLSPPDLLILWTDKFFYK